MRELIAAALVTHVDLLRMLSGWKGGMAVLVLTFLAGAGAQSMLGEAREYGQRITDLEEYRETHEDTVTGPRVRQVVRLAAEQRDIMNRLDRIESLLSCLYYEIETCPSVPGPPPSGGGE